MPTPGVERENPATGSNCGPGVAMLAASYATERGLTGTALVPEFGRYPEDAAVERRDAELVALADAAVIVWDGSNSPTQKLRALVEAKGIAIHVLGEPAQSPKARRVRGAEAPEPRRKGMLPD